MAKAKTKPKQMSEASAKFVASLLVCPHKWGDGKEKLIEHANGPKRGKAYKGTVYVCISCGIVRVDHDGISSMYPPQDGKPR